MTENSVWDDRLLAEQLKELSLLDLNFSLETTGFEMGEIDLRIEGLSSLMRSFLRRRYGAERGPSHMWFGVSVENGSKKSRIRHLQDTPAGIRFLSIEPLIGPMGKLDCRRRLAN